MVMIYTQLLTDVIRSVVSTVRYGNDIHTITD